MAKRPYQIYLEEDQYAALQYVAQSRGVTMADVVREAAAQYLLTIPTSEDPAMKIVGLGRGKYDDISLRSIWFIITRTMVEVRENEGGVC